MRHLIALVLIFSFSTAFSKNQKIDSLQLEVNKAKGTNRILQLNELAIAYWDVNFKKSITLGNEALKLAKQYNYYTATARSYNIIGVAYYRLKDYPTANYCYDKSLKFSEKYGTENDQFKSLFNKIIIYTQGFKNSKIKYDVDKFVKLCVKRKEYDFFVMGFSGILWRQMITNDPNFNALKYFEVTEKQLDADFTPSIYTVYAAYYGNKKQEFKAIGYIKKILKISNDKFVRFNCYCMLGDDYMYLRRFNISKQYYIEAIKLAKEINTLLSLTYIPTLNAKLGSIFLELGDYSKAQKYLLPLVSDKTISFTQIDMCSNYSNLGLSYLGLDSIAKADYYINWSLSLSDSINSISAKLIALQSKVKLSKKQNRPKELGKAIISIASIIDSLHDDYTTHLGYQQLTDYYKSTGDNKKSLHYLEKWAVVNDSLKSTESLQIFNEFQTKHETEKKEQQIVLQGSQIKSQHSFLIVLSISGVLLLIAFVFIYILYNKRNQAYKQLVLQSIGKINNEELFDDTEILSVQTELEEVTDIITNQKNNNNLIDEATKNQIKEELQMQLSEKVYLDDSLTIIKLATLCNTNRTYLSQVINETYQINFNTFINKLRIDEAKKLLLDESFETPLKHLSTQLGFSTYTVFNDAFKKFIGVTPAFFLKTVKAERGNS